MRLEVASIAVPRKDPSGPAGVRNVCSLIASFLFGPSVRWEKASCQRASVPATTIIAELPSRSASQTSHDVGHSGVKSA